MDNIVERLSKLIKDPEFEKLKLSLKNPNLFSILKVEGIEIRHSHFLAWLLDPNGTHNLGNNFLRWFLRDIFSENKIGWANEFIIDSLDLSGIRVYREWNNIDLLIVSNLFVICIENKVWSKEHSNQLSRYREIVKRNFPKLNHAFVFLNPDGVVPENEEDAEEYVVYTYEQIKNNLEIIFNIYSDSLSERVMVYLEDYYTVLRRDIMNEHETIEIARQIYKNHKEALDFIFQYSQEERQDLTATVSKVVQEKGFVLCTLNKNKVRFLTSQLDKIIPRTGNSYRNKESFVFEFILEDKIKFQTVISPGNEHNKKLLNDALFLVQGAKRRGGRDWSVPISISINNEILENNLQEEEIKDFIIKILDDNKLLIDSVEKEVLKVKDYFEYQ